MLKLNQLTENMDHDKKLKLLYDTFKRYKFDPENEVMEDLIIELAAEIEHYRKTVDAIRRTLKRERELMRKAIDRKRVDLYFTINNFYGNDAGGDDV